jgi:hypothetical protein
MCSHSTMPVGSQSASFSSYSMVCLSALPYVCSGGTGLCLASTGPHIVLAVEVRIGTNVLSLMQVCALSEGHYWDRKLDEYAYDMCPNPQCPFIFGKSLPLSKRAACQGERCTRCGAQRFVKKNRLLSAARRHAFSLWHKQ